MIRQVLKHPWKDNKKEYAVPTQAVTIMRTMVVEELKFAIGG